MYEKTINRFKTDRRIDIRQLYWCNIQMKELQEKYESFIFIADMHATTIHQDPKELHERIRRFIALYIACGIDPNKNIIYLQSENEYIPAISWLLECNTYYGEASRMIQFKEKRKCKL